jgi:hypothetical protein
MEPISSLRKIPEMITMNHYEPSTPGEPHRGDIYRSKPVAWLRPPLWLLRYDPDVAIPGDQVITHP